MNISTISYWFAEALASMKKNMKNVLISVSTMIATMLIIAVGYIIFINAENIIEQKQDATSKISAYLDIDVTDDEVTLIRTKLMGIDGVKSAEYVSQDEAIKSAAEFDEMLVLGYAEEELKQMYQPYYRITFNTVDAQDKIIETLKNSEGVGKKSDDIQVPESAKKSILFAKSIKIIAQLAMILIVELSVFLMMNSTKLMLYARRKEISIMKYVGAKDSFVKIPFAIEGVIISLIAVVVVFMVISLCYEPIIGTLGAKASYKYLTLSEVMANLQGMLLLIGIGIGVFGSTISMNKYLDV